MSQLPVVPEFRKVEALLQMGRSEEAVALVGRLPQRESPNADYLRLRGRALRAAGRHFDAEESFREALALAPSDAGLLADLATTLVGQKRFQEAIPFARDAVSARPEVAAYHALLGFCAERLELLDEATRALDQARVLAPADAEAHTVYAFHAFGRGKLDDAERAFRDALACDPRRSQALRGLARVALSRGDEVSARERWLEALSCDPRLQDARLAALLVPKDPAVERIRRLGRMPLWSSLLLALGGASLLWWNPSALATEIAAVGLFAVASIGPIARQVLSGGSGE